MQKICLLCSSFASLVAVVVIVIVVVVVVVKVLCQQSKMSTCCSNVSGHALLETPEPNPTKPFSYNE